MINLEALKVHLREYCSCVRTEELTEALALLEEARELAKAAMHCYAASEKAHAFLARFEKENAE